MSIESVKNICLKNSPDVDIEAIEEDILKQMRRFERVVKTAYNESQSAWFWSSMQDHTKAKNDFFERNKLEYVHRHLEMLIDLYDYKRVLPFKKKEKNWWRGGL